MVTLILIEGYIYFRTLDEIKLLWNYLINKGEGLKEYICNL